MQLIIKRFKNCGITLLEKRRSLNVRWAFLRITKLSLKKESKHHNSLEEEYRLSESQPSGLGNNAFLAFAFKISLTESLSNCTVCLFFGRQSRHHARRSRKDEKCFFLAYQLINSTSTARRLFCCLRQVSKKQLQKKKTFRSCVFTRLGFAEKHNLFFKGS